MPKTRSTTDTTTQLTVTNAVGTSFVIAVSVLALAALIDTFLIAFLATAVK